MKLLLVTAGPRDNPVVSRVEYDGELTVWMARHAAVVAFGHTSGVTVLDSQTHEGYRLTAKSVRKVKAKI